MMSEHILVNAFLYEIFTPKKNTQQILDATMDDLLEDSYGKVADPETTCPCPSPNFGYHEHQD